MASVASTSLPCRVRPPAARILRRKLFFKGGSGNALCCSATSQAYPLPAGCARQSSFRPRPRQDRPGALERAVAHRRRDDRDGAGDVARLLLDLDVLVEDVVARRVGLEVAD